MGTNNFIFVSRTADFHPFFVTYKYVQEIFLLSGFGFHLGFKLQFAALCNVSSSVYESRHTEETAASKYISLLVTHCAS